MRLRPSLEALAGALSLGAAAFILRPPSEPAGAPPETRPPEVSTSLPQPVASYTLNAELDAPRHRVKASGSIVFTNRSNAELSSLFFHLYLNAFKNDRSVFLRSPFGASRDDAQGREFGYIDVQSLHARELGNVDLWPGRQKHSPADADDETDIEVPLPRPLLPGETLTLDVRFEAQLPEVMERTGYAGSFHFVAQWFPKLARLEPNGQFAHFTFHPQAEFYADFGHYDVTLDVPREFTVGATGTLASQTESGARKQLHYVADGVHDFAWTAWDHFQEQRFRAQGLDVRVLFPEGHAKAASITQSAVAFALPYFERRFGRYPYSTLTVVHPPRGAEAAGGMEYPTLITTGGEWYLPYLGARDVQTVVVHELGHQWFYGVLASNEARSPFLDEGLNSYAEEATLEAYLGERSLYQGFGLTIAGESLSRVFASARGEDEPIASAASDFSSFKNLGALVYSRTATLLMTLERVYGKQRFERAMATYAARFRFQHPTPEDFLGTMGEELGQSVRALLEKALFERGRVDYVVRDIQNARTNAPAGYFERPSGRERVARPPSENKGSPVGRVTVYRHGSLEIPVDVLLVGRDGSEQLEHWDGRGPFRVFEFGKDSELHHVVVDPAHKILLDDNLFNNQASVSAAPLSRVHERFGYFAALAFSGALP